MIDLLSSNYEAVQEQAIVALISLSEVDEGSNAIREQRGIPPLIALLQSSNAALLLVSTKLLTKLAKNGDFVVILLTSKITTRRPFETVPEFSHSLIF